MTPGKAYGPSDLEEKKILENTPISVKILNYLQKGELKACISSCIV